MKVSNKIKKDLRRIPSYAGAEFEQFLKDAKDCDGCLFTLADAYDIVKLKKDKSKVRVRLGDYRAICDTSDDFKIERFLHRKQAYK